MKWFKLGEKISLPLQNKWQSFYENWYLRQTEGAQWGLVGILWLLVLGSAGAPFYGIWSKHAQIQHLETLIQQIRNTEEAYQRAKFYKTQEEGKFKNNPVSLFGFLQTTAARFGLSVSDLEDKKTEIPERNLMQISTVVNLKEITVDRLTAFLKALEDTHPEMVQVTRLKIKARFDSKDLLDVQMTVSTWKNM